MLIRFSVENFKSFHGKQTFSMEADEGVTDLPGNTVETPAGPLLKTASVYGHNASGKTNLIAAMEALARVVLNSGKQELPDEVEGMIPFALENASEICDFEIELILKGRPARYRLAASAEEIFQEWLFVYEALEGEEPSWQQRFHRQSEGESMYSGRFVKSSEQLGLLAGTGNGRRSVIGHAAAIGVPDAVDLLTWFRKSLDVQRLLPGGGRRDPYHLIALVEKLRDSEAVRRVFRDLVKAADIGAVDFALAEAPDVPTESERRAQEDLAKAVGVSVKEVMQMAINNPRHGSGLRLLHGVDAVMFDWGAESTGTRRFIELLAMLLPYGEGEPATLVVDELDSSLSPDLLDRLIRLFHDPEVNRSASQLIFTTHDRSLMDAKRLLRRDQVWITQKGDDGATELYSLADFDEGEAPERSIPSRRFATGRYGGVAEFGRSLETLLPAEKPQKLPEVKRGEE